MNEWRNLEHVAQMQNIARELYELCSKKNADYDVTLTDIDIMLNDIAELREHISDIIAYNGR